VWREKKRGARSGKNVAGEEVAGSEEEEEGSETGQRKVERNYNVVG
jgi:hypothetical protein